MTQTQTGMWITNPEAYRKKMEGLLGDRDPLTVMAQTAETNAQNVYVKARNNLDMVLGRLLEANHVDLEEAYSGKVQRPAGPLPVLSPN